MPGRLATFLYHEVTDDPRDSGFQRASAAAYKMPTAAFRAHLDALAGAGLPFVTVADLAPLQRDALMITLDDGGRSNLRVADELERRGIVGHFFVCTGLLGEPGFLDRGGVAELARRGHVVGSHSHAHPRGPDTRSPDQVVEDWRTSRAILEDVTGAAVLTCSIPGGDLSPGAYDAAARAGYRTLFDSEPRDRLRVRAGMTVVGRVTVKAGTSAAAVGRFARFRGFRRARLVRLAKRGAKRVVYPIQAAARARTR